MKILLINQCFYPDVVATAQMAWDLAKDLADQKHKVTVIASRSIYGKRGGVLPRREGVAGVQIERVGFNLFGKSSFVARIIDFGLFYVLAIWRALRLPKQDVVICLTTPPFISLVGWLLRLLRGTRFIYWVMDLYPDLPVACGLFRPTSPVTRLLEGINRFCLRRADAVVVLGRCMRDRVIDKQVSPSRIRVIHVWSPEINVESCSGEGVDYRRQWGVGDRLLVMYSGNFGIGHEIETIAQGAANLENPDKVAFALVGGGKRKAELAKLLQGVSGLLVIDAPYQPRSQLPQLLAAADVHLASLKQGVEGIMVPSKLYGILAAGRPIVYVGGASGEVAQVITESGCGVVVAPGDWATFCAAISRYLSDPDQRQREGSIGQRIGERCWGFERALDRWRLLVQEIATKGSGR